jgi:hypothetical protein
VANKITAQWEVSPSTAFTGMYDEWVVWVFNAVRTIMTAYIPEAENWMKSTAPWQDRTGNLRASLYAVVEDQPYTIVELVFDYGLDYGVYLEFKNQGRFAIIAPALDYHYPRIMADIQRLLA